MMLSTLQELDYLSSFANAPAPRSSPAAEEVRVLCVEDDEDDHVLISDLLHAVSSSNYAIDWVSDYDTAIKAITSGAYHVCLLDYRLGDKSGLELLREISARSLPTPIILLTGNGDYKIDLEAMRAGATDYFLKSEMNSSLLDRSIRYAIERKRAEESLRRVNRALKMLSECNQAMFRAENEDELHDRICRIILEVGAYSMAWVGRAEDDEKKSVRPIAQVGDDKGYLSAVEVSWSDVAIGQGPVSTAIRTGRPSVVNDIIDDPFPSPWRARALKYGYRSLVALPLSDRDRTFGALSIYSAQPHSFTDDEVNVLMDLAGNLAFGSMLLRMRAKREMVREQMRHTQKMEAVGVMASGITHDFNNLLGVILGYTEVALLDVPAGTRLHNHIETIHKAGLRAKELVQRILAFSRDKERERKSIELAPLLLEAAKLLRVSIHPGIEIRPRIDTAEGEDAVLADPIQIQQVLMNLASNAGHAMGEGGGVLELTLSRVELGPEDHLLKQYRLPPGLFVKLTVTDTGHGIDPEITNRIFDPYFTTKERGKGTGLGLSVVHGIVKSHRGAVRVLSTPGQGSTFEVFLPSAAKELDPKIPAPRQDAPRGRESILFVDDEPELGEVAGKILASLGYRVVTRSSGIEALDAFRTDPGRFDIVVTDYAMHQMNGIELAEELLRVRPDIPIVLCSGYDDPSGDKDKNPIFREFILKPLTLTSLATIVRRVLDNEKGR